MATPVDIANLALAHLGDSARLSSLDEASPQAGHCARFYPIARASLLAMHPWKFATRREAAAQLNDWSDTAWPYAYHEPNGALAILAAYPTGYTSDLHNGVDFITESDADGNSLILTKAEVTTIKLIFDQTNPAKFSPLFTEALAWMLASYVAGPLIKGDAGRKAATTAWQLFLTWYTRATVADGSQMRLPTPSRIPPWLQRGANTFSEAQDAAWPQSYPVNS